MSKSLLYFTFIALLLSVKNVSAQSSDNTVKVVGAMKNVMRKGQLFGTISLDTIANKQHLYGLGPIEFLKGELLIVDGKAYQSSVISEKEMKVEENYKVKAPFFVYANINDWKEQILPDSVKSLIELENYLDTLSKDTNQPFAFRLSGIVKSAIIHIVNLPAGTKVSSPEDAHQGKTSYQLTDKEVEIIGFFSKQHQAIFTHHDTFIHTHLITKDISMMGHLEKVLFVPQKMKVYLSK
jgi:acetolactate decarboxylase